MSWKKLAWIMAPALTFVLLGASSPVRADLVTNGGFGSNGGNGQLGFNTNATGWTSSGYNFLYAPGTADTSGANGQFGNVQLWGPGNGSANGLPATSPAGGYFVAADTDFEVGAIQQTINGLTPGDLYRVKFWWAGAQQEGFFGPTKEQWQVSFGSETKSTPFVNISSEGFSGWIQESFTFKADGTSDVLSFLAQGTPGEPPFALLDGVSVNAVAVPEPASLTLTVFGLLGLGAAYLRRRFKSVVA